MIELFSTVIACSDSLRQDLCILTFEDHMMSTANRPLTNQAIKALTFYQSQKYTEVRDLAEKELCQYPEDAGLRFLSGLAACRLEQPTIGIGEIKKAKIIFPQISDFYCMEAVNWQRGIANFVDHMEANFFQYIETCVTENFLISYPKCGRT